MLISMHGSVFFFINPDVSAGYDYISHQVWLFVHELEMSAALCCSAARKERGQILDHSSAVQKDRLTLNDLQIVQLYMASKMYFALQFKIFIPFNVLQREP